jgi:hypothetical protein
MKKQVSIQHKEGQHRTQASSGVQRRMVGKPQVATKPEHMKAHGAGDSCLADLPITSNNACVA